MMQKTIVVLCLAAVIFALPVDDIKAPIEEASSSALDHGPALVAAPDPALGPALSPAPSPVLGPSPGPALGPALVPPKHAPADKESDLKTDATEWSYYRYNSRYFNVPSVYSYNTPIYYSYWNSHW